MVCRRASALMAPVSSSDRGWLRAFDKARNDLSALDGIVVERRTGGSSLWAGRPRRLRFTTGDCSPHLDLCQNRPTNLFATPPPGPPYIYKERKKVFLPTNAGGFARWVREVSSATYEPRKPSIGLGVPSKRSPFYDGFVGLSEAHFPSKDSAGQTLLTACDVRQDRSTLRDISRVICSPHSESTKTRGHSGRCRSSDPNQLNTNRESPSRVSFCQASIRLLPWAVMVGGMGFPVRRLPSEDPGTFIITPVLPSYKIGTVGFSRKG